jgi:hypothetical protein
VQVKVTKALVGGLSLNPLPSLFIKLSKDDLRQLLVNSHLALDPFVQVVISVGKIFNGVPGVYKSTKNRCIPSS